MEGKGPGGYSGKLLRVNLSDHKITTADLDPQFCRKYVGGSGFITHFLLKEIKNRIDPFSPDNKLIFALGPVTGTGMIGSGRNAVGAKSPLSGGIILSQVGEFWGAELKRAGYDAIIVEGRARKPVYLWVNGGEVSLRDAGGLWGLQTKETQEAVRSELGDPKVRVAMIGPGGENLVRCACIMNGLYDAAGRGGAGAVMGSKNLKAIAVRGHKAPRVADPERLKELRRWLMENMYSHPMPRGMHEFGTGGPEMEYFESVGVLPVRNFRDGVFPGIKKVNGVVIKDTIRTGMDACFACPVRCKKIVKLEEPFSVDPAYGGPEYETMASFGSNCGIDNLAAVCKANQICNAYGLDTISAGGSVAFAMECFEKGLLSLKDSGGIKLEFGNAGALLEILELIGRREGPGKLLAEGSAGMARVIQNRSTEFAINVKGVEPALIDPRYKPTMALGFMVNPHGADHVLNMHDDAFAVDQAMTTMRPLGLLEAAPRDELSPRKIALLRFEQFKQVIIDCMVNCASPLMGVDHKFLSDTLAAVTGWDTGVVEQMRVAEKVLTMARLFNVRQGLTADDDTLPARFFGPKTDGPLSATSLDPTNMEKAKKYYYTLMGWDPVTGIPLPEKLEELDIARGH
jgi:aldehyde:ferredoxin oxidoreductase